jgi:uncharacterized protein (TIGR02145 family)
MKKLLFLIIIFCALKANAQEYLISFAGTGESSSVSTVKVENLMSGVSLNINGSDILRLTIVTEVNSIYDKQSSELKIYPNPMTDNSTLEIFPPVTGNAVISVLDMTGKQITQIQSHLENLKQAFRLSGLKNGFYLVNVKGNNYQFSGKLFSNGKSNGTISIEKVNNITQAVEQKVEKTDNKGTQATIDMAYTTGDRLKFTGISGNYSTVITDIPASNKTITFNFIACTDGDNNNYPVVEIGSQVWMAENLKTTKYKDGSTAIPLVTDGASWVALTTPAYCWQSNDEASYKATYGALYNWYTVSTGNLCPTGWHAPTDYEWTTLENYLIDNGYNYDGTTTGNKIAKALGSTTLWNYDSNTGTVGNTDYPAKRNATGFTALPGGYRFDNGYYFAIGNCCIWWSATADDGTIYAGARDIGYVNFDHFSLLRIGPAKPNGISVRCVQGVALPDLTTTEASSITQTSAICGGNVTSDGGDVTVRGVCWNTSGNPTIADNHTLDGTGTGIFTSNLIGLTINTKYYVKAFATNSEGTSYGNEIVFGTRDTGPYADYLITFAGTGASTIVNTVKVENLTAGTSLTVNGNDILGLTAIITAMKKKTEKADSKGVQATVDMAYTSGDRLKFTGISGIYSTVITDIPASDKTITFNFIACTDGDNNNYPVVEIDNQVWMAENLKTTKYNDGTAIPNITDNTAWAALTTGAYSDYNNTPANSTTYGRLYNWYAVDNNWVTNVASNGGKNVCPTSWHMPSDGEWTSLTTFSGGETVAGDKLKETGTTTWTTPNTGATNETGFTALPGGYRDYRSTNFIYIGDEGIWWSSTESDYWSAWFTHMSYGSASVGRYYVDKPAGNSVRCVKDNYPGK